jgi:capsular exopolysaccharide synthesis family protein
VDNELYNLEQSETTSAQQTLQTVLRFLRLVLRYRMIVVGFLAAAVLIGVVKYKRTPSSYQASAKMMIRNVVYTTTDKEHARAMRGMLASYKQLLLSDEVLLGAIETLEEQPPELRGAEQTQWPGILRSILSVSFDPKENIVEVSCRSRDPESTASVIRAIIQSSEQVNKNDRHGIALQMITRLEEESHDVEQRLKVRRSELLEARKTCGDISSFNGSDESHPTVKRVSDISNQLNESRSRRAELESMLRTVQGLARDGQDLAPIIPLMEELVGPESIQRIPGLLGVSQEWIEDTEAAINTLETELVSLGQHFGNRHPEISRRVARKNEMVRQLNAAHQTNRNRFANGIRDSQVAQWMFNTVWAENTRTQQHHVLLSKDYESAEQEALTLTHQLADVRMAERDVQMLQERYSSLLNRLSSIEIGQDEGGISVRPLNEPLIPGAPIFPVLSHTLGLSICLGLFASLALIYVIDLIDDRLRSPEDVQSQLGLPILGVIRPLPEDDAGDHLIYVHGHPLSVQTECFRTIRTSITLSDGETRCLAITSSEQSEGKTTLTSNLAATFAQTGSRTLLIDADMRRPGLSKMLELRGQGGLSEILRANDNVSQMCQERTVQTEVPGLDVLPCGPRMMNAGVLLSMPALAAVLDWAVAEYDQVLVDCPPTLPVSDASIVGNFVDGMLFLLNPEKTHRRSALRAVDRLRSVGMNIVGVITNSATEAHAGSYGYGYGYGQEYTYGHDLDDEPAETETDDVVAGATFERSGDSQRPYSLLSNSADDDTNDDTTDDPDQKAA